VLPGRWLRVTPAAVAAALLLSGCSSGSGVVEGHVLIFSPGGVHPGSTTTVPIARFTSTVEAKRDGRVVASDTVLPGHRFRFVLPPGNYTFTATGAYNCGALVSVNAGRRSTVDVRCVEP
jgi:hypothetical protein